MKERVRPTVHDLQFARIKPNRELKIKNKIKKYHEGINQSRMTLAQVRVWKAVKAIILKQLHDTDAITVTYHTNNHHNSGDLCRAVSHRQG